MPQVVLISGSGTAQRSLVSDTLERLQKDGYSEVVRQEGGTWPSLLADNLSSGLFSQKRVILVEDAESLGAFPESSVPLLEKKADVVLLLVYGVDYKKSFSKEALPRIQCIKIPAAPKPWEKERWIRDRASEIDLKLSPEALTLLAERIDDLEELKSELLKIGQVSTGGVVSKDRILNLSTEDGLGNMLHFLDGLCEGEVAKTLAEYRLLSARKNELLPAVTALHNRIRLAWYAARFPNQKIEFQRALLARDYAWKKAQHCAKLYSKEALLNLMTDIVRIQFQARNGSGAGWLDLELALIRFLESRVLGESNGG